MSELPAPAASLGLEIKRRRLARGWTLEQLAERAGLTPNFLGGLENGTRAPSLGTVITVAAALGVPPGELFGSISSLESSHLESVPLCEPTSHGLLHLIRGLLEPPPDGRPPSGGAAACRAPALFEIPFRKIDRRLEVQPWKRRR
jgi:transcriptional regulator with XRE-family HTH domain